MSKSLLQQLYDGEIYPAEEIVPEDPKYREMCHDIRCATDEFEGKLTQTEQETFEQITTMEQQLTILYAFENFSYGFRLGVRLMADAFAADNDFE